MSEDYKLSESKMYTLLNEGCTLLNECNQLLKNYHKSIDLRKVTVYKGRLSRLFENSDIDNINGLFEHQNFNSNIYSKLCKINSLINDNIFNKSKGYLSLNEELNIEKNLKIKGGNAGNFSINDFKNIIDNSLKSLKTINDISDSIPSVLKIKRDLNIPINIWGFDVKELVNKFNTDKKNGELYMILYDMSTKKLLCVFVNVDSTIKDENTNTVLNRILSYNIETDEFIYEDDLKTTIITNMRKMDNSLQNDHINIHIFEKLLKFLFVSTIVLYKYVEKLNIQFSDNLFSDEKRKQTYSQIQQSDAIAAMQKIYDSINLS